MLGWVALGTDEIVRIKGVLSFDALSNLILSVSRFVLLYFVLVKFYQVIFCQSVNFSCDIYLDCVFPVKFCHCDFFSEVLSCDILSRLRFV